MPVATVGSYVLPVHTGVPASEAGGVSSLYLLQGRFGPRDAWPAHTHTPRPCRVADYVRGYTVSAPCNPCRCDWLCAPLPHVAVTSVTSYACHTSALMNIQHTPQCWRMDIVNRTDPQLLASSLAIPHCWTDNGCPRGSMAALRHAAASAKAIRGHLFVVSAVYGPTPVTKDIQAMIDGGIRLVHFGHTMAKHINLLPDVRYIGDLVHWCVLSVVLSRAVRGYGPLKLATSNSASVCRKRASCS
jgi:hypothetical protein